jgi:hypothetical protein
MQSSLALTALSRTRSRLKNGLFVGGGERVGGLRSWLGFIK